MHDHFINQSPRRVYHLASAFVTCDFHAPRRRFGALVTALVSALDAGSGFWYIRCIEGGVSYCQRA